MPVYTSADDLSIVLSGGSSNINPNNSIGGDPSATPILNNALNNLFDDVTADESREGHEDYRCIYIFNDGETAIYSFKIWISNDFDGGATMELGIEDRNETQRITISGGNISGGYFNIHIKNKVIESHWMADLGQWATILQNDLLLLTEDGRPMFRDVSVIAQNAGAGTVIFDIRFNGLDAKKNHPKFEVPSSENFLEPLGVITVVSTTPQEGAPIATIAPELPIDTTPPGGVNFFTPTELSPITLPKLEPNEGFPLWIKRIIPPETTAKESDGFILRMKAESLEPTI
jgi:hypothetical protein